MRPIALSRLLIAVRTTHSCFCAAALRRVSGLIRPVAVLWTETAIRVSITPEGDPEAGSSNAERACLPLEDRPQPPSILSGGVFRMRPVSLSSFILLYGLMYASF